MIYTVYIAFGKKFVGLGRMEQILSVSEANITDNPGEFGKTCRSSGLLVVISYLIVITALSSRAQAFTVFLIGTAI